MRELNILPQGEKGMYAHLDMDLIAETVRKAIYYVGKGTEDRMGNPMGRSPGANEVTQRLLDNGWRPKEIIHPIIRGISDNASLHAEAELFQSLDRDQLLNVQNCIVERWIGGLRKEMSNGNFDPVREIARLVEEECESGVSYMPESLAKKMVKSISKDSGWKDKKVLIALSRNSRLLKLIIQAMRDENMSDQEIGRSITVHCDIENAQLLHAKYRCRTMYEEDLKDVDEKFDIVIGNPPYGKERSYPEYCDHMNKAAGLVREGGCMSFLIPSNWKSSHASRLKKFSDNLNEGSFVSTESAGMFKGYHKEVDIVLWVKEKGLNLIMKLEGSPDINLGEFKIAGGKYVPLRNFEEVVSLMDGEDKIKFIGAYSTTKFHPTEDNPIMIVNAQNGHRGAGVLSKPLNNLVNTRYSTNLNSTVPIDSENDGFYYHENESGRVTKFGSKSAVAINIDAHNKDVTEFINSAVFDLYCNSLISKSAKSSIDSSPNMSLLSLLSVSAIGKNWKTIEARLKSRVENEI